MRKGDDAKAHKELNQLGGNMGEEKEMDTGKAQNALSQLTSAAAAEKAAKLERERELSKVKIDRKDVELIMAGPALCPDMNSETFPTQLREQALLRSLHLMPAGETESFRG